MSSAWPVRPLSEVCTIRGGGTPSKAVATFWEGSVPWISPKDMKSAVVSDSLDHVSELAIKESATSIIPAGAVLIVVRSGILARTIPIAVTAVDLTINQDLKALCPHNTLDVRFLYHFLAAQSPHLLELVTRGATVHRLTTDSIRCLSVPVPPMPEQRRIVAILDEAFAGIAAAKENAEQNLRNSTELFDSRLSDIISGMMDSVPERSLGELTARITDGDHQPPPKAPSGVPFITIGNIDQSSRTIDFSETFKVPRSYFDSLKEHRRPRDGDLLYTVTGSFGIPVLVPDGIEFCFQRHIALIRPADGTSAKWLYYLLQSKLVRDQADAGATGTAQRTVSLRVLRGMMVPDLPRDEQVRVVEQLDAMAQGSDELRTLHERKLAALDELKQSLLHHAFTGQL